MSQSTCSYAHILYSQLSSADIIMFHTLGIEQVKTQIDSYPELKAHCERIGNIPNIKKWIETRPVTQG